MAKRTVIYQHCLSRRCFRETLEKAKNNRGHINMTCTGWQTDTCADHHQNLRTWLKVTPGSRKKNRQKMANTEGNKSRGREGCSSRFHHDNPPTERRIRGRKGSNRDWAVVWGAKKHGKGLYIPWFVYECGTPNCQVSPTSCKSSSVMYKMLNQPWE